MRVIFSGWPELPRGTMLARRNYAMQHHDWLRSALMSEPRGHADMYGCLVTAPFSPDADFGVLFLHNEGFSSMCGHGIIGVATVVLETGLIPMQAPETKLKIETPAGLVEACALVEDGRVQGVRFRNVPSFVLALDEVIEVPGLGSVKYDLAFGGAFYAFVQAEEAGVSCTPEDCTALVEKGMRIKRAIMQQRPIKHPFEEDLGFLYGTIFIGSPLGKEADSRNVCIFAEGEVDRSPTGTGVSARLALHHAREELAVGQRLVVESIIGSTFAGRVLETVSFGPYPAVVPEVEGQASLTGRHEFVIDPTDPLKHGFSLDRGRAH